MNSCVISIFQNAIEIYEHLCQPICKKYEIHQTALDIILFLANNPEYNTAKYIHKFRGIKQSMVSFYVEKLVQEGFLVREVNPNDRRQVKLICTEKAQPVIDDGRTVHQLFLRCITENVTDEQKELYINVLRILKNNIMNCVDLKMTGKLDDHINNFKLENGGGKYDF